MLSIDWKISRELNVPINEQIKGQIIYAISFGTLQSGDALPSVRELAGTLKVSPVTVSKVYRELTREGLLAPQRSIGVFVNDPGISNGINQQFTSQSNLVQIIKNGIRQARLMGYSLDQIQDTFQTVANQYMKENEIGERIVIIVGNTLSATTFYALEIQKILHDLKVKAIPCIFDDLINHSRDIMEKIDTAKLIITLPERLREVRERLSQIRIPIVTIAFEISPETIQKLSSIKPNHRLGIISTNPEFIRVLVNELESYVLVTTQPIIELIQNMDRVKRMLPEIDVLIYATGSEKVLEVLPDNLIAFEFLHKPKLESVNRLRILFSDEYQATQKGKN
jgi:DNA-binding transcriptional regulator YhcF (GntR family)